MFDDNELFEQSIDEVLFSQMLDTNKESVFKHNLNSNINQLQSNL